MAVDADGLVALDVGHSGREGVALVEPGLSQEQLDVIVAAIQAAHPELRALILQEAKSGKTDFTVAT